MNPVAAQFDGRSIVSMPIELLNLAPLELKEACDAIAHDLLGEAPVGQSPSHQLREAILAQVLFESISRQKRKERKNEGRE